MQTQFQATLACQAFVAKRGSLADMIFVTSSTSTDSDSLCCVFKDICIQTLCMCSNGVDIRQQHATKSNTVGLN